MSCTKGVCNVCVYACECVGRWNVARLPIVHIGCLGTHLALGRETTWMRTAIRECEHVIRVLTCEDTSNSNTRILYYMFGCLGIVGCHIIVRLSYYLVAGMPYFKHIQLQNQVFSYFFVDMIYCEGVFTLFRHSHERYVWRMCDSKNALSTKTQMTCVGCRRVWALRGEAVGCC